MKFPNDLSDDQFAALVSDLKLTDAQVGPFRSAHNRVLASIRSHQRHVAGLPEAKERKRLIGIALSSLDQLLRFVERHDIFVERKFINVLLPLIGELASIHGLERLVGHELHFSADFAPGREPLGVARARTELDRFRAVEEHLRGQRMSIAEQVGPRLIQSLFKELAAPLRQQIKIETSNKGGRPQDLYRNYMIQELSVIYAMIYGKPPPSGKTGDFVKFCQTIFDHIGMAADGLESAVARIFRNQARRSARASKPPA